ncbi:hypothetical protein BVY04_04465 [bacterium M21]|nr:hypothetical protein BVY04_04465 [bacterium M21]
MDTGTRKINIVDFRALTTLGILALILVGFYVAVYFNQQNEGLDPHLFFAPENLGNMVGQTAIVGVLACGMTFVIVSGHIDLSVGSLLGMLAAIGATLTSHKFSFEWNPIVACGCVIIIGALLGALHGVLITKAGIPAFVVTLGGLMAYRGGLLEMAGETIPISESVVTGLGTGLLSPTTAWILGGIGLLAFAFLSISKIQSSRKAGLPVAPAWQLIAMLVITTGIVLGFIAWISQGRGLPIRFIAMIGLAIVIGILATKFRFGRHVYAIGGNVEAARFSGIRVALHTIIVFAIMGAIAGIAGIIQSGEQMAASADAGDLMELYAIAACVIGGTSLKGGRGTIFGSILGAMIMASIRNGLSCLGVSSSWEKIILGIVLVAAVGFDLLLSGKKNK